MSRRLIPAHPRINPAADNNPYQPTTHPIAAAHLAPPNKPSRNGCYHGAVTIDTGLSDDTFTDSQSHHDYYHAQGYRRYPPADDERSFSDESRSTGIPYHYNNDDESCRRWSRNTFSSAERSCHGWKANPMPIAHKDPRRVYPQQYGPVDAVAGVYQEIPVQQIIEQVPIGRLPDRPQSTSSGVASAIVDGCGGKCQTFENICYFFLQLVFMMGILIGVSLCIAGLVLRKSAARNLQVLVYIGILLAGVSAVLLGIQCNARNVTKRRKMAVRNAKRAPIPLETLNHRGQHVQQPLMAVQDGGRVLPQILRPMPLQQDQQGIPWWRRKDLV